MSYPDNFRWHALGSPEAPRSYWDEIDAEAAGEAARAELRQGFDLLDQNGSAWEDMAVAVPAQESTASLAPAIGRLIEALPIRMNEIARWGGDAKNDAAILRLLNVAHTLMQTHLTSHSDHLTSFLDGEVRLLEGSVAAIVAAEAENGPAQERRRAALKSGAA